MSNLECLTNWPALLRRRDNGGEKGAYRISLTVSVDDVDALWAAAAAKALGMPGMTLEDVYDVLGPREDPAIADCLSMLAAPPRMPGCTLEDFAVERLADVASARRPAARPSSVAPLVASRPTRMAPIGLYRGGDATRRTARPAKSRLN